MEKPKQPSDPNLLFKQEQEPGFIQTETLNIELKAIHTHACGVTGIIEKPPFKFTYICGGVWMITKN